jgi:hypothetical protein
LKKGDARLSFRMDSKNNHHGMLDCFVFTDEPFEPRGTRKPGEATKIDVRLSLLLQGQDILGGKTPNLAHRGLVGFHVIAHHDRYYGRIVVAR